MSKFELYLFAKLDAIQTTFVLTGSVGLFTFFMFSFFMYMDEGENLLAKYTKTLIALFACLFIGIITPSTKDIAVIYGLNYLTNNPDAKAIPDGLLKLINDKIQEEIKD